MSCDQYTDVAARYHFWPLCQEKVLIELEELAREGWEPLATDLPSGIQLRSYKTLRLEAMGWILMILLIISSFGFALIFLPFMGSWYYELTGYRIQLRQQKQ